MFKKTVIPVALLTAFALTPVVADQSGSKADREQEEMGGQQQEYNEGTTSDPTFDDIDRNKDGKLDEDELNTWGATAAGKDDKDSDHGEKMLERYDRDDDGTLSEDEFDLNEGTGEGEGSGATAGDDDMT